MNDTKKILLGKFDLKNRYSNFGTTIKKIKISGFRGISNLTVEFEYPITAISGLNGSGKSTIGQLLACSYKEPSPNVQTYKRKYISSFFPINKLDPKPFVDKAYVEYSYLIDDLEQQEVTIYRRNSIGWSTYEKQPEKHCFYIGILLFVPKIERRDLSIYNSKVMSTGRRRIIPEKIKRYASNILNCNYEEVAFQSVSDGINNKELGVMKKNKCTYSENHMGFGEGRLIYFIDYLENKPNNSLFIIEEPEISLHEDAQYKFIKYLIDVCNRKHHQIILTTHSSIILDVLPPEGRKLIIRDSERIQILDRVSANKVKSILSDGHQKALIICMEDKFAILKLKEIIRRLNPHLLSSLKISPIGDTNAVANAVTLLINMGFKAIGIRDADTKEDKNKKIFKLPGFLPPEREVYEKKEVQEKLNKFYNINIETILSGRQNTDHHKYGEIFAEKAYCSVEDMDINAIRAFFDTTQLDDFRTLLDIIEKEL